MTATLEVAPVLTEQVRPFSGQMPGRINLNAGLSSNVSQILRGEARSAEGQRP